MKEADHTHSDRGDVPKITTFPHSWGEEIDLITSQESPYIMVTMPLQKVSNMVIYTSIWMHGFQTSYGQSFLCNGKWKTWNPTPVLEYNLKDKKQKEGGNTMFKTDLAWSDCNGVRIHTSSSLGRPVEAVPAAEGQ